MRTLMRLAVTGRVEETGGRYALAVEPAQEWALLPALGGVRAVDLRTGEQPAPLDLGCAGGLHVRGIVDGAFLRRMHDGALLVNVSRGPIVRTDALLAELESGRLRAALDVTDPEPLPEDHPLWSHPKVLITPHIASVTQPHTAAQSVIDNIRRHRAGEELIGAVDRTLGY